MFVFLKAQHHYLTSCWHRSWFKGNKSFFLRTGETFSNLGSTKTSDEGTQRRPDEISCEALREWNHLSCLHLSSELQTCNLKSFDTNVNVDEAERNTDVWYGKYSFLVSPGRKQNYSTISDPRLDHSHTPDWNIPPTSFCCWTCEMMKGCTTRWK